jgi:hypothetical protein
MNAPARPGEFTVHFHPRRGDGALADLLRREIEGEVLFDRFSRGRYSTDASIYQVDPVGVVAQDHQERAGDELSPVRVVIDPFPRPVRRLRSLGHTGERPVPRSPRKVVLVVEDSVENPGCPIKVSGASTLEETERVPRRLGQQMHGAVAHRRRERPGRVPQESHDRVVPAIAPCDRNVHQFTAPILSRKPRSGR